MLLFVALTVLLGVANAGGTNDHVPSSPFVAELALPSLDELSRNANTIFIGEVVSSRQVATAGDPHTVAAMVVEEVLRGEPPPSLEIRTPPQKPGSQFHTGLHLVEGYKLLVFMHPDQMTLEGGIFYLEANHAWRNKQAGKFLNPRLDRDWVTEIDPSHDYTIYTMEQVRSEVLTRRERKRWKGRQR